MNLNRVLEDIKALLLVDPSTPANDINTSGEVAQSKFKLAIDSGNNSDLGNRCIISFMVGISCSTHEELLDEIGKTIFKLKGKSITDSGVRDVISLDGSNGFQIFTPESGKWIANLKFEVPVIYTLSTTIDNSMFSDKNKTEVVNVLYE